MPDAQGRPYVWEASWWTEEGQAKVAKEDRQQAKKDAKQAKKDAKAAGKWWSMAGDDVVDAAQAVGGAVAEAMGYGEEAAAVNAAIDKGQEGFARTDAVKRWGSAYVGVLDAFAAWVGVNGWARWAGVAPAIAAATTSGKVQQLVNRLHKLHPDVFDLPDAPALTGDAAEGALVADLGEAAGEAVAKNYNPKVYA